MPALSLNYVPDDQLPRGGSGMGGDWVYLPGHNAREHPVDWVNGNLGVAIAHGIVEPVEAPPNAGPDAYDESNWAADDESEWNSEAASVDGGGPDLAPAVVETDYGEDEE